MRPSGSSRVSRASPMSRSCSSCVRVSGSRTLRRTVSTCPGAAATTASHPSGSEPGVGGAPVLGAGEPLDQPAVLQPVARRGRAAAAWRSCAGPARSSAACARAPPRASRARSTRSASAPRRRAAGRPARRAAARPPPPAAATPPARPRQPLGLHATSLADYLTEQLNRVECYLKQQPNADHPTHQEHLMAHLSILGTGNMGQAIAAVAAKGGHTVQLLGENDPDTPVTGDIVVLAVPYPAVGDVIAQRGEQLAGKIVVDITNPLNFETFDSLVVPADSSAAAEIAAALPAVARAQGVQHHLRRHPRRRHRRPADHHRADRRRRRRRQVDPGRRHHLRWPQGHRRRRRSSGPASSRPSASCSSPSPPTRRSPGPAASASSPDPPTPDPPHPRRNHAMTVNAVRLNHAVLFVADLERSIAFYQQAFGMAVVAREPRANAAFLRLPRSGQPPRPRPVRGRRPAAPPARRARALPPGVAGRHHRGARGGRGSRWPTSTPTPASPATAPPRASTPTTPTATSSR